MCLSLVKLLVKHDKHPELANYTTKAHFSHCKAKQKILPSDRLRLSIKVFIII